MAAGRAWGFLVKGDGRQHGGNLGYDDVEDRHYSFDSTVPNSRHVNASALAVVHDGSLVIGTALIESVEARSATKTRRRCPACRSTDFKARTQRFPTYRCGQCRVEFESPDQEFISVIQYRAIYGSTWIPTSGVTVRSLEAAFFGRAKQHAIRELDRSRALAIIGRS